MSPGINNAKIPAGSLLGYKLVRAGKISAKLQPLVANVERWARDNVGIAKTKEVSKTFEAGDWTIELDLYSGDDGAAPQERNITVRGSSATFVVDDLEVLALCYDRDWSEGSRWFAFCSGLWPPLSGREHS
jgi:hypothetical protein